MRRHPDVRARGADGFRASHKTWPAEPVAQSKHRCLSDCRPTAGMTGYGRSRYLSSTNSADRCRDFFHREFEQQPSKPHPAAVETLEYLEHLTAILPYKCGHHF